MRLRAGAPSVRFDVVEWDHESAHRMHGRDAWTRDEACSCKVLRSADSSLHRLTARHAMEPMPATVHPCRCPRRKRSIPRRRDVARSDRRAESDRMRGRHEARLERGRREINSVVEHPVEEAVEALHVAAPSPRRRTSGPLRENRFRTCRRRLRRKRQRRRRAASARAVGQPRVVTASAVEESRAPGSARAWRGPRPPRPDCPTACRPDRRGRAARCVP